jgi:transaldolase
MAGMRGTYLEWAVENTPMKWWHDSAEPGELRIGLERGAVGVTTNPFLSNLALHKNRHNWAASIEPVLQQGLTGEQKGEALMRIPVIHACEMLMPEFARTRGEMGYVCAQVNPSRAGERDCMAAMMHRFHRWAPNIAVKLPGTAAGLDVLEDAIAEGITVTCTVSFTVPQALAIGERCRRGTERARINGVKPGRCFAVLMIGRLDDYLREVARDSEAAVTESDIRQAGLAVAKRAYRLYRDRAYEAVLLVAALRGDYHMTELAGADLVMSIHPACQPWFVDRDHPREERIDREIPNDVIERLSTMPEFLRAYEPDGMRPFEFITYGPTQRTICQFIEAGWKLIENLQ